MVTRPSSASDRGQARGALILLILILGVVFLWLLSIGRLEAVRVADTPSYMEASRAETLKAVLSHHRTLGFPALIRALYSAGTSTKVIPFLGVSVYFFGILLFFFAVRRFSGSSWLAFAASVPLPFAGVMRIVSLLQPDFLSAAFVLVSISCLLFVVTNPRLWLAWVGLGLSVALAYQLRPAAQFLVVLVPIFAGVFLWLRDRSSRGRALRLTAVTATVTLVPFLVFCTLRAVTVGNFGLVSFGGSNLAGSVVNFLDDDLVKEVPADSRSLARKIFRQRQLRGWEPMRLDSDPVLHFQQGSDNTFRIARQVAKAESRRAARRSGADAIDPDININVDLDRRLTRLATQIVRLRPVLYLNWIRHSFLYGLDQLWGYAWISITSLLLVLSLPIAWLWRPTRQEVPAECSAVRRERRRASLWMLTILAVGYFVAYLLLVSCTYFPFDRYFVSMTLFIPSALAAGLYETWTRIPQSL